MKFFAFSSSYIEFISLRFKVFLTYFLYTIDCGDIHRKTYGQPNMAIRSSCRNIEVLSVISDYYRFRGGNFRDTISISYIDNQRGRRTTGFAQGVLSSMRI